MDEARWEQLVARWEERDRRWEERDRRWEAETREHREFMRYMWQRIEGMDVRQQANHEEMIESWRAVREALWALLDRLGEGPQTAS